MSEAAAPLLHGAKKSRTWRLVAAICVVVILITAVSVPVALKARNSGSHAGPSTSKQSFAFDDLFAPKWRPQAITTQWIPFQDVLTYRDEEGNIWSLDASTEERKLLLNQSRHHWDSHTHETAWTPTPTHWESDNTAIEVEEVVSGFDTSRYSVNADFILLALDTEKRWRHSCTYRGDAHPEGPFLS